MPENNWEKPSTIEAKQEAFKQRLKRFAPKFLEIRQKMGLAEDIGLASLPEIHLRDISLGALPEIRKTEEENLEYTAPGLVGQVQWRNLSSNDEKNILIWPEFSGETARVVSIFDPDLEDAKNLLEADEDVLVGLAAHELAHAFSEKTLPPETKKILEDRFRNKPHGEKEEWRYHGDDESEIDLAAALSGYKKEVTAKLDFVLERIGQMGPYFKNKERIIEELKSRKNDVLAYCP
ncbi:MAG: hypothetical protein PHQ47_02385 [Candidatus Portnoybacteria bacterium]|nr:hypothetical protein [Candidatus Portnoybacteria bacterium]